MHYRKVSLILRRTKHVISPEFHGVFVAVVFTPHEGGLGGRGNAGIALVPNSRHSIVAMKNRSLKTKLKQKSHGKQNTG